MTTTRRLAAILAADVAGYSRLMAADEVGTLAALKAARREVIDPAISEHKGRIVKTSGDGMLVEFASAVDAITCAMAVQEKMAARGGDIAFRIGINVGDIIIDGDDIFGDGVNIAARVENECEPGGVSLSAQAFDQVRNKTAFAFDDLGERSLKNIDRPVRLFRIRVPGTEASVNPADLGHSATSGVMSDGASIALLPFNNMTNDADHEYFADGIVEDIITALARYPRLFVVARNSSFAYKGQSPDIRKVGRDLGVRYVLEGSVRKAAGRVRITAQLIEAESGRHIWAEKYEARIDDIFELQDRIVASVVGTIEPQIQKSEIDRASKKRPDNLTAYDLFLRAKQAFHTMTEGGLDTAMALGERALAMDPGFAPAAVVASSARGYQVAAGRRDGGDINKEIDLVVEHALTALALDPNDVYVLGCAGRNLSWSGRDYEGGLDLIERACRTFPYSAFAWGEGCWVNTYCAKPTQALECGQRALELSPRDPFESDRLLAEAAALLQLGEFEQAVTAARRSMQLNANVPAAPRWLTASLALAKRTDETRAAAAALLRIEPGFTISRLDARTRWKPEAKNNLMQGLRLAGLPE